MAYWEWYEREQGQIVIEDNEADSVLYHESCDICNGARILWPVTNELAAFYYSDAANFKSAWPLVP